MNPKLFWLLTVILFVSIHRAEAQQAGKIPRIGLLQAGTSSAVAARTEAFRRGLRDLGYVDGKNIVIEYRYAEGKLDRLPSVAAELVRLKLAAIVTSGAAVTRAVKKQLRRFQS
jgi:putative ABC transport system substrate-binding protein